MDGWLWLLVMIVGWGINILLIKKFGFWRVFFKWPFKMVITVVGIAFSALLSHDRDEALREEGREEERRRAR